jgi:type III pantothenate kinase
LGQPAIVLDAGTALTVDAMDVFEGAPRFLGGAIAPGPALLAWALGEGARQLYEVDTEGDVPALGRDTREALLSGLHVGFQGAASELVRRIGQETGLEQAPLWLTGSARAVLANAALFDGREPRQDPWLVHRGLLASLPGVQ